MKSLSLIKQSDDSSGPPNYRLTNSVAGSNCASCTSFQNPGMCTKYSVAVSPQGICDSYEPFQPDLKAIQNAKPVQAIQANLGPSTDFNSELKFGSDNTMNKQADMHDWARAIAMASVPAVGASALGSLYGGVSQALKPDNSITSILRNALRSGVRSGAITGGATAGLLGGAGGGFLMGSGMNDFTSENPRFPQTTFPAFGLGVGVGAGPFVGGYLGHKLTQNFLKEDEKKKEKTASDKANDQSVDSQLAFKRGFLLRCAEEGLSLEQTHQRIKQAMSILEKKSFDLSAIAGKATDVVGSLTGGVLGGGALLLPIATGVAGGIAYNKLKPHEDIDTLKREDLRNEYYRLADNMKRKAIIKRLQEQNPGSVIKL